MRCSTLNPRSENKPSNSRFNASRGWTQPQSRTTWFELCSADIEELNGRAGYQPGIGYVDPAEAADDVLDELLQPYLDRLRRHAKLGMTAPAVDLAVGILHDLHRLRGSSSGTLLEHSPDYADERAAKVVRHCAAMGVTLPFDDLAGALSGWESLIQRCVGLRAGIDAMGDAGWAPLSNDGAHRYESAALSVYWPEAEFGILIARWPVLTAQVGATWDEHRQLVERHCSAVQRAGLPVLQLPGDLNRFSDHLATNGVTTPGKDDLDAYPDLRTVTQPLVSWPPARTAACWCGSGRKYKQCCRRHGLGTLA